MGRHGRPLPARPRCGRASGIPLIYGVDAVHGHGNLYGATVFPHNIGLGATRDPAARRRDRAHHGRGDARDRPAVDVRALHLRRPRRPLGPDVRELQREPRARRAAGDRDRRLSGPPRRALATPTACSPPPSTTPATATPTYGTAAGDYTIDQGITITSARDFWRHVAAPVRARRAEARRRQRDAVVLERRLDRGRRRQPAEDARPPRADQGVLKGRIGFDGFVISDWEGIHQIPGDWPTAGPHRHQRRHRHGMEPNTYQRVHHHADRRGQRRARPDERGSTTRCRRILTKKFELGLFEHPFTDRRNIDEIGSAAHRAVARRGGRRVAGAAQEPRGALPLRRPQRRLRRRLERRQHRQPGRRLDAHLAGRLDAT